MAGGASCGRRVLDGGVAMGGQERGQVTSDGRIRRVGQPELLESRLMCLRSVLQCDARQEPFDQQRTDLVARHLHLQPAADQARSQAGQIHGQVRRSAVAEQLFLDALTDAHQHIPLRGGQLVPVR